MYLHSATGPGMERSRGHTTCSDEEIKGSRVPNCRGYNSRRQSLMRSEQDTDSRYERRDK